MITKNSFDFLKKLILLLILSSSKVIASEKVGSTTDLKMPKFVMLKSKDVNMRSGPGINYPIKTNYRCYHLPLYLISEFDNWRLVKDSNGNDGWIHEAMLDRNKYVEVIYNGTEDVKMPLLRLPSDKSKIVIKVDRGTIARLAQCKGDWCKVSLAKTYKGWIHKKNLWGI